MGRSQVLRNRTKGRPGERGRGRCRGGRGGGGAQSSKAQRNRANLDKLGDNSYRFERDRRTAASIGEHYDGLLDDINFIPGASGEYYGESHETAAARDDDLLADATAALSIRGRGGDGEDDWMKIDMKLLEKRLCEVPIHKRLNIPWHVGKHIEDQYGASGAGKGRARTIAQMREAAKIEDHVTSEAAKEHSKAILSSTAKDSVPGIEDGVAREDESGTAADDEEDLEAWLDDMIS
ncbi:hypothetical protein THAOC_07591 [Thalassiosira oceanica]|uniref:Uncharacterized protein n=1 Tax=Thalassiosira oceanica TaxID=159749 RepID=K0T1E4_THAOC|nr:hypothetical protein THAOC_07591 [Thalassiosira oceanica]|mmetsp:Transcript_18748/g.43041  ORF Transcript_18748/g.43041 Transcript_18748/m.43041 type:complete len:236 (+) Transcript_18748:239-946(+)|eukprot:EJK71009.1 hypothetical protein THAOC_07591 [Thalassiosira oceanica]